MNKFKRSTVGFLAILTAGLIIGCSDSEEAEATSSNSSDQFGDAPPMPPPTSPAAVEGGGGGGRRGGGGFSILNREEVQAELGMSEEQISEVAPSVRLTS